MKSLRTSRLFIFIPVIIFIVILINMTGHLFFKVSKIIKETPDAITIDLVNSQPVQYNSGQFLTFIFNREGKELRRSYSLSSTPEIDQTFKITLKRIVNGEISTYLYNHIKVGDTLETLPPNGRFTIQPDSSARRDIFLIAAGSGISPVYSILKMLLVKEPLSKVTLIYCNRNEQSTIFYHQLNELAARYPKTLNLIYIFSDPKDKNHRYKAHLNLGLLEQLISENLAFEKDKAEFFICGPFPFMRMADTMIVVMGFDESRIHKENFVIIAEQEAINTRPNISDKSEKKVTITYKGDSYTIQVPYDKTILNAALEQGHYLPYSCKAGICGTCAAICKEGKVLMSINDVLTAKDLKEGWVLTCVGYPSAKNASLQFI